MKEYDYVYAIIWSTLLLFVLFRRKRSGAQYMQGAKMALWWVLILAFIFGLIVYWPEFKQSKFYNSLVAGSALVNKNGSMEFARSKDGHFHINAKVNGVPVEFMVDTGAADIVLNRADARAVGFYPDELEYNKTFYTANGTTRGASVKLKNIEIGSYQSGEIYASVNQGELDVSLLGMSFLDKMHGFWVEGDKLILQP